MLEDYNAMSKKPMELVIFPFAVEHVCRVLRIVKQPLGNALLAGVGGSGRQSLTALATHMADFTMFQIELSKNYDNAAWKDDLKRLLRLAGEKGDSTVFCFSDTQAGNCGKGARRACSLFAGWGLQPWAVYGLQPGAVYGAATVWVGGGWGGGGRCEREW